MHLVQSTNWGHFPDWNLEVLVFLREGKTGVPGEKPLGAGTRTNNKFNPHDAETRNRTRATLVGGECSHHCTIPAPLEIFYWYFYRVEKANQSEKR